MDNLTDWNSEDDVREEEVPTRDGFRMSDALPVLALGLWLYSIAEISTKGARGSWGLFGALPITFFVALFVISASVVLELRRRRISPVRMAVHVGALILMIQGTIPSVYGTPREYWQYKAVGETQFIIAKHGLMFGLDIYQRFPGFFGLVAWFDGAAGLRSPLAYLAWSQIIFDSLVTVAFYYAAGAILRNARQLWLATFLFIPADWVFSIGQDFFTPQAIGLFLNLIIIGLILRRSQFAAVSSKEGLPGVSSIWIWMVLGLFAVGVISHPLSPAVLLLQIWSLIVLNRLRPVWLGIVLAGMEIGFLLINFSYLKKNYFVTAGLGKVLRNLGPAGQTTGTGLLGSNSIGPNHILIPLLTGIIVLLAGIGMLGRLVGKQDVKVIGGLALSPMVIIAGVHYGTETTYRALMFGLPWAIVAAVGLIPTEHRRSARVAVQECGGEDEPIGESVTGRKGRLKEVASWGCVAAIVTCVVVLSVIISYSQTEIYQVDNADVAMAKFLYDKTEPGVAVPLDNNFPLDLGSKYPLYHLHGDVNENASISSHLDILYAKNMLQQKARLNGYACYLHEQNHAPVYLIVTASQVRYGVTFGLFSPSLVDRLEGTLLDDNRWAVIYRSGPNRIFKSDAACGAASESRK